MVVVVMASYASMLTTAPLAEGMVNLVPPFIWHQSVQLPLAIFPPLLVSKSIFTSMVSPAMLACVTHIPVAFW